MEEESKGRALITLFKPRRNPAERDPILVDIALPIRRNAPAFLYRVYAHLSPFRQELDYVAGFARRRGRGSKVPRRFQWYWHNILY